MVRFGANGLSLSQSPPLYGGDESGAIYWKENILHTGGKHWEQPSDPSKSSIHHGDHYEEWVGKWSEVVQSCLTLCDPTDCSLPGSSVYGIFQARALEWAAISFSMSAEVQSVSLGSVCFGWWCLLAGRSGNSKVVLLLTEFLLNSALRSQAQLRNSSTSQYSGKRRGFGISWPAFESHLY